jgi:hypothetical protein
MINSLKRLRSIFRNPGSYFADPEVSMLDGAVVILALFLVTFLQKLVWADPSTQAIAPLEALKEAAINSLMVWSLFSVFFFALGRIFKKYPNLMKICGMVGAAGVPVVITTFISALSWLAGSFIDLDPILPQWLFLQNGLTWLGLALSWPGLFGYHLLYDGLKISRVWSILLTVTAFAIIVAGKLLPLG